MHRSLTHAYYKRITMADVHENLSGISCFVRRCIPARAISLQESMLKIR
jgi:hypothetical protein